MIEKFDAVTQDTLLNLEKTQRNFWNISRQTAESELLTDTAECG